MDKGEKILQILENSACLKPDQLIGYLEGTLFREELRVVELHLASCPLCQEALEGMENIGNRQALISSLVLPELTTHKTKTEKPAEANNTARQPFSHPTKKPATPPPSIPKSTFNATPNKYLGRPKNLSWLGIVGIAALLLLGGFLFWQYESNTPNWPSFTSRNKGMSDEILIDSNETEPTDTQNVAIYQEQPDKDHKKQTEETRIPHQTDTQTLAAHQTPKSAITEDSVKPASLIAAAKKTTDTPVLASKTADKEKSAEQKDKEKNKPAVAAATQATEKEKPKTKNTAVSSDKTAPAVTKKAAPLDNSDYSTGLRLYRKKQYASALLYLRSAASNDQNPNHWEAVYYSGLCNIEIGKKGRGRRFLKRVAKAGVSLSSKAEQQLEKLEASE